MSQKIRMEGEFETALPVLKKLKKAGYEAYFVGGSVRDALLGLTVNDVDIATNAYPEEVKHLFSKTVDIGIEHGTVLVLYQGESYEVTTFRTESTYQDFRRPDSVTFVRSLKEDLKRRDFTINAFAIDETGEIHDYFDGLTDLKNQVIKAVGVASERFNEDALRMMRGVRFASQLGFAIEEETKEAITQNASLLKNIATERIQVEFVKLLLGKARDLGIEALIASNLYCYCPKLAEQKNALEQVAQVKGQIKNERQAWTLVLHFIEEVDVSKFLREWKTSNQMIHDVKQLMWALKERLHTKEINPYTIYSIGKVKALEVETMLEHLSEKAQHDAVQSMYDNLPIHSKKEMDITGHDLMNLTSARPGKWLGEAMDEAEKKILSGELSNQKNDIIKWIKETERLPEAEADNETT